MKYIISSIIMTVSVLIIGCQDVTIGYLLTEDAIYETDSMIVKRIGHNSTKLGNMAESRIL